MISFNFAYIYLFAFCLYSCCRCFQGFGVCKYFALFGYKAPNHGCHPARGWLTHRVTTVPYPTIDQYRLKPCVQSVALFPSIFLYFALFLSLFLLRFLIYLLSINVLLLPQITLEFLLLFNSIIINYYFNHISEDYFLFFACKVD